MYGALFCVAQETIKMSRCHRKPSGLENQKLKFMLNNVLFGIPAQITRNARWQMSGCIVQCAANRSEETWWDKNVSEKLSLSQPQSNIHRHKNLAAKTLTVCWALVLPFRFLLPCRCADSWRVCSKITQRTQYCNCKVSDKMPQLDGKWEELFSEHAVRLQADYQKSKRCWTHNSATHNFC